MKEEKVAFRFFRLDKAKVGELLKLYPKADVRPARDGAEQYVVSWWLRETEGYDWLNQFIAEVGLCEDDYGLFVSVLTDFDSDIIRVPQFALRLSRQVGGVIDFSYTFIEDE